VRKRENFRRKSPKRNGREGEGILRAYWGYRLGILFRGPELCVAPLASCGFRATVRLFCVYAKTNEQLSTYILHARVRFYTETTEQLDVQWDNWPSKSSAMIGRFTQKKSTKKE